jgi:WD40 repeat protein
VKELPSIGEWLSEKSSPSRQAFFKKWIPHFILKKEDQKAAWMHLFLYRLQQSRVIVRDIRRDPMKPNFSRFLALPQGGLAEGGPYGTVRIFSSNGTVRSILENAPGALGIGPFVMDLDRHVIKHLTLLSNHNIATLTESGNAQIWDMHSKKLLATLPLHNRYKYLVAWSNGGFNSFSCT